MIKLKEEIASWYKKQILLTFLQNNIYLFIKVNNYWPLPIKSILCKYQRLVTKIDVLNPMNSCHNYNRFWLHFKILLKHEVSYCYMSFYFLLSLLFLIYFLKKLYSNSYLIFFFFSPFNLFFSSPFSYVQTVCLNKSLF